MASGKNVMNYLDNLIDEQGLKTEVEITLTDRTLMHLALTIVGSVTVSAIAYFVVRRVLR